MPGVLKTFPHDGMGDGAFMFGQFDPNLSSEQGTLAATAVEVPAGTVLGKITATGLYTPLNPAAADGSQNWAGILYGRRRINTGTQRCAVVVRRQGVNGNLLTYLNAVTAAQKAAAEAQAAAAGVIVRY
jgi:hypothetical protein